MAKARLPTALPHDPLGKALHPLKLIGTLYCKANFSAPWGVSIPHLPDCLAFPIITQGSCLLEIENQAPLWINRGQLILIPHGLPHVLRSEPQAVPVALEELPVRHITDVYETVEFGGGGELTQVTYGVLKFDHVAAKRLVSILPKVIQVNTEDLQDVWLEESIRMISAEASHHNHFGSETMITRLTDILVIQTIRSWIKTIPKSQQGWLAALYDEQIGRALSAIHKEPSKAWSLETLCKEAGMSRSAFAARFSEIMNQSPMRYLMQWRMQLAKDELQKPNARLADIAEKVGYGSEAAFCKAYKRCFGVSPASHKISKSL